MTYATRSLYIKMGTGHFRRRCANFDSPYIYKLLPFVTIHTRDHSPLFSMSVRSVEPHAWEDFSDANIVNAEQQCHTYDKLHGVSLDVLKQTCNDLLTSRRETNRAFERRIAETDQAKRELEDRREKARD